MIKVLQTAAYRHGYLIITAAWLYTISFLFLNYLSPLSSADKVSGQLSDYLIARENKFKNIESDTNAVKAILSDTISDVKLRLSENDFGVFAYAINDIGNPLQVYWNTNRMNNDASDLKKPDGNYFVHYQNGYFELVKKSFLSGNKPYFLAALIPVKWEYTRESKYLINGFPGFPEISNTYNLTGSVYGTVVKNSNGESIYKIQRNDREIKNQPGAFSTILRISALLLFAIFLNALAKELVNRKSFIEGFTFLAVVVLLLRLISYYLPFPFNFRDFDLFDPLSLIYSSSSLHPSLGDLLVNTIIFYWLISFLKFNSKNFVTDEKNLSEKIQNTIAAISLFIMAFVAFEFANLISSLIVDSKKIYFDVTNFFSLNIYTFISFVVICFIVLSFFYLSQFLTSLILQAPIKRFWRLLILATAVLLLLSLGFGVQSMGVNMIIFLWLILYMLLIEARKKEIKTSLLNSPFFLIWAIFLMASVTALMVFQNQNFELEQRKKIAEKINDLPNEGGDVILNITNFPQNFLENNFYRFYNEYASKKFKDSIINANFSGYLNKYNARIYTFDSANRPLYNDDSTTYFAIRAIVAGTAKNTDVAGLYYFENVTDRYSYIYQKQIKKNDSLIRGTLFVVVKPNAYKSDALTPELFRAEDDPASDISNYSYAVYNKRHIIQHYGSYNFTDSILKSSKPPTEFGYSIFNNNGVSCLLYNAGNNKIIELTRENHFVLSSLTMFAYLFGIFIAMCVLLHFGNLLIATHFKKSEIKRIFGFNIRAQIQTTIITISLLSFIVIGIATISFFVSEFNKDNKDKLVANANIMVNEIEERIKSQLVFDDMFNVNDVDLNSDLERNIVQIASIHNIDVNFYDLNGNLEVSSQHDIYSNQLVSKKMQPDAYYAMHYRHSIGEVQDEQIGNFSYISYYVPVRDEKGAPLAYLNVPYLNSHTELNKEISNFLVTLIILNALIFILAGAIAIIVTSRITSSFSLIGNKMKEISIGKMNEEIVWKSNDELGILVNEYNKMVQKLGQSAQALARSEREGAWREMARQVAHEIKNPLTPMKLSIQYLQKAINNNASNVKELSQQVANTLIEQIEQLSKIAGDFSQFANIANVKVETFDISETIASLITLYSADSRVHIQWNKENAMFSVHADKLQMNRLFTNLIKNAIEAVEENQPVNISINQYLQNNNVVIAISDNGSGIPQNMQQKIFMPNFTTKSSGTGLGLAICRGIAENANGNISFTTKQGIGSTFVVTLPLA